MVIFYNMLDVARVGPFVIWISLNPDWSLNDERGRRRKFLKQLSSGTHRRLHTGSSSKTQEFCNQI